MSNKTVLNTRGCSLCVSGVHFDIGPRQATLHCHCEPHHGRMVGVFGPNGCGKSSLFKALAGIDEKGEDLTIDIFKEMVRAGKTLLVVHHDWESAPGIFDEVLVFRYGRLEHLPDFRNTTLFSSEKALPV